MWHSDCSQLSSCIPNLTLWMIVVKGKKRNLLVEMPFESGKRSWGWCFELSSTYLVYYGLEETTDPLVTLR